MKDLVAFRSAVEEAGLPPRVLTIGATLEGGVAALASDRQVDGVAVAGSVSDAKAIEAALAARDDRIVPLVLSGDGIRIPGGDPVPGGPHYLYRFVTERTIAVDTTAAGGNASLLSIGESVESA